MELNPANPRCTGCQSLPEEILEQFWAGASRSNELIPCLTISFATVLDGSTASLRDRQEEWFDAYSVATFSLKAQD